MSVIYMTPDSELSMSQRSATNFPMGFLGLGKSRRRSWLAW